jgi:cytochrome c556
MIPVFMAAGRGAALSFTAAHCLPMSCRLIVANREGDHHMIRTVFAVAAAAAITLGVCAAVAQDSPIKARKALMKANGAQAKMASDMIKGDKPFDMAAVHKIFAQFQDAAAKMPGLYPAGSESEANSPDADDFSPKPAVWENMADFKARFAKFGDDAKAADASVMDLDSFKASMGNIGKNDCGGCHELYRAKKS